MKKEKILPLVVVTMMMLGGTLVIFGTENAKADVINNPPSGDFRTPAEWESTEKVLIRENSDYQNYYDSLKDKIPSSVDITDVSDIDSDVDMWIRDYGPISIMENGERKYVDMNYDVSKEFPQMVREAEEEDQFPKTYAQHTGEDVYRMEHGEAEQDDYTGEIYDPVNYYNDGGNFMIDNAGLFYPTNWLIDFNLNEDFDTEQQVKDKTNDYFNYYKYREISGSKQVHKHVDMHTKLLSEHKVLISEGVDGYSESGTLDNIASYFNSLTARDGQDYDIYRVPAWESDGDLYTYTNSLIVENTVILPTYNCQYDDDAVNVYQNAMPNYNIKTVDSSNIITHGGAVHCTTMQIPKENNAPEIYNIRENLDGWDETVTIKADISEPEDTVSSLGEKKLYYKIGSNGDLQSKTLTENNGDLQATIQDISEGTTVKYFIKVVDSDGAASYNGDIWNMHEVTQKDTTSPWVDIYSPSDGASLEEGTIWVYWNGGDGESGIDHYEVKVDDGSWNDVGLQEKYGRGYFGGQKYTVTVKAVDECGNTQTDSVTFYVESGGLIL